jgi:hypothetical protein
MSFWMVHDLATPATGRPPVTLEQPGERELAYPDGPPLSVTSYGWPAEMVESVPVALPANEDGLAVPSLFTSTVQLPATAVPPSSFWTWTVTVSCVVPTGVGPAVGAAVTFGVGFGVSPGFRVGVGPGITVGLVVATTVGTGEPGSSVMTGVSVWSPGVPATGVAVPGATDPITTSVPPGDWVGLPVSGPSGRSRRTATRPTITRPMRRMESRATVRCGGRGGRPARTGRSTGPRGVPPPRTSTRRSTSSFDSSGTSSKPLGLGRGRPRGGRSLVMTQPRGGFGEG